MLNLVTESTWPVAAPPTDCTVLVVRDTAALEQLVPAWQGLASAAAEPNIFYEPWMLLPALRALGSSLAFRFVFVYDSASTLCGFFPLTFHRSYRRLPVSVLRLWVNPYMPLGTPLIRADALRPCLDTFLHWLATDRASAALMAFDLVSADGPFATELAEQFQSRGSKVLPVAASARALFRRGAGSEEYLKAALSGDQRKSLRRKAKRLAEGGEVACTSLAPGADLGPWLDDFLRLEAGGWKGRAGTALTQVPAERAFFEAAMRAAHALGRLRFVALTVSGRPIAYQIYFPAGRGAFAYKTAYDEEFARFSPGTLIQTELIRVYHEQAEFDWMDSTSEPDGYLNELWPDRRGLQSLVVATGSLPGKLVLAALPRLENLKRKLFHRVPSQA